MNERLKLLDMIERDILIPNVQRVMDDLNEAHQKKQELDRIHERIFTAVADLKADIQALINEEEEVLNQDLELIAKQQRDRHVTERDIDDVVELSIDVAVEEKHGA